MVLYMKTSEKWLQTQKHPAWLDTEIGTEYIDEGFMEILMFYVIYSPCPEFCTRGHTLQYYGWKKKPWNSNRYLKNKLNKGIFENNKKYFQAVRTLDALSDALKKADLMEDFYRNIGHERVAFFDGEQNSYMSLFYHIRCALAHGRLAMYPTAEKDDLVFVMENGSEKGKRFLVKGRMVLRKSTLLRWARIIQAGPTEDEGWVLYEIYCLLCENNRLTMEQIAEELNESKNYVEKKMRILKDKNIIEYQNHGKNSWWNIDKFSGDSYFRRGEENSDDK